MSFADRLARRADFAAAAERPSKSQPLALCLPQLLMVGGRAQGLANLEVAPFLVGGLQALRILDALDDLFQAIEKAGDSEQNGETYGAELRDAAAVVRQLLDSVNAASDLAHAEHEAKHQHERGFH